MSTQQKVIVLNGLAHGGTNITWNILQSHPAIVNPMSEINEVLGKRGPKSTQYLLLRKLYGYGVCRNYTQRILHDQYAALKRLNLADEDNKFKAPAELYTEEEIDKATLCLKGVSHPQLWDLQYSSFINSIFDQAHFIFLIRHGHAVCESWIRRGYMAKQAGYHYSRFGEEILQQNELFGTSDIIRFEDVLQNPFETAQDIFEKVGEPCKALTHLRLKAKKVIHPDGSHKTPYGALGKKYWFTQADIHNLLIPDVGTVHRERLSSSQIKIFNQEASTMLDHFNYPY